MQLRPNVSRQPPRVVQYWTKLVSWFLASPQLDRHNFRYLRIATPFSFQPYQQLNKIINNVPSLIIYAFSHWVFFLFRRMSKVVWSVGGCWSLLITGIVVEGDLSSPLNFTSSSCGDHNSNLGARTLVAAGRVSFHPRDSIPCLFIFQRVHDARQGPSVGHTFSNAYFLFSGCPKRVVLGPIAFGRRHIKKMKITVSYIKILVYCSNLNIKY